jgi:hypothetical protein
VDDVRKISTRAIVAVFIAVVILVAWNNMTITVEPKLSKISYNESENPPNWVGPEERLRANFSGHFYIVINRDFDKITLWITPGEGARTTYIRVKIRRKFLNGLYLEVEPPWYGKVDISREESPNEMTYLIQVKDLGEAGKATYQMRFVDRAPEDQLRMDISVEVRDGIIKYKGELPVVILEPNYGRN